MPNLIQKLFIQNLSITSFDFRANKNQTAEFKIVTAGVLRSLSGQIIATDGFEPGNIAFTEDAPCGEFPVELFLGYLLKDIRPAASRIKFKDSAAIRWEPANYDWGEESPPFDDPFRIGVDSGSWCYMDKELIDQHAERLCSTLEETAEKVDYQLPAEGLIVDIEERNTIIFPSGTGDGFYASYWGYDANEEKVELLTDFELLEIKNEKIVITNTWLMTAKSVI